MQICQLTLQVDVGVRGAGYIAGSTGAGADGIYGLMHGGK